MPRRLDHVVLASRDLAAQAEVYRHMGFRVGALSPHPWGTHNHIIQFADSFLTLICADEPYHPPVDPDPRVFPFAAFVHDFVQERDGAAMLALSSADPQGDARAFHDADIGDYEPFHFERPGKRGDGATAHAGFALAFAHARTMPGTGFLTCCHERPEDFWDRGSQDHANGVKSLGKATLVAENPADHAEFLSSFSGVRDYRSSSMGVEFSLEGGQAIEVLTPPAFAFHYGSKALPGPISTPQIVAIELQTASMSSVRAALTGGRIAFVEHHGRIVVSAERASGVAIAFAAAN